MAKNIVLIGFMGSGKTTVGKILAEKTGKNLSDTDELIELGAQKPIKKIFEDHGEDFFRRLESRIIEKLSIQSDEIISTGGGAVINPVNIENLKKNGLIFHLYAPAEELYERIKNFDDKRPLLGNKAPIDLVNRLLESRKELYNLAHFKIDTQGKTAEKVADEIIEKFYAYSNSKNS